MERYRFNMQGGFCRRFLLSSVFVANKLLYCNWKVNLVLEKKDIENNILQRAYMIGKADFSLQAGDQRHRIYGEHLVLKM